MANHKSTKKRIRSSKVRQEGNKYLHKTVRNAMGSALVDTSKEGEKKTPKIISMIDKLEKRNVIHKNKAARLKSKLTKKKSS
jgi:small subunit ribosomal protein S20